MTGNLMTGAVVTARDFGRRHVLRSRPALHAVNLDISPGQRVLLTGGFRFREICFTGGPGRRAGR